MGISAELNQRMGKWLKDELGQGSVRSVNIHCEVDKAAVVTIERYILNEEVNGVVQVLESFELVPRDKAG